MQYSLVNTDLFTKMHSATYQETIILNTKIFSLPQLTEYIMVHVQAVFLSSKMRKPALVPAQPTIQWIMKFFPRGTAGWA